MSSIAVVIKFWQLHREKKSAAIDLNIKTGEIVCRCTHSIDDVYGNGTPPISFTDDWLRINLTLKGVLQTLNH